MRRAVQVSFVRPDEPNLEHAQNIVASQIEEHSDQIGDLIDHVVRRVGIFVLGYVVLDTARQMLIASARKR